MYLNMIIMRESYDNYTNGDEITFTLNEVSCKVYRYMFFFRMDFY